MVAFLSIAKKNGCIGSTFAEDDERIIVYGFAFEKKTVQKDANFGIKEQNDFKLYSSSFG